MAMKNLNVSSSADSLLGRRLMTASLGVILILVGYVSPPSASSAQVAGSELQQGDSCGSPEECFAAAVWPKERLGNSLTKDQVVVLKLERLRRVMEQFPNSIWAKRAGLLSGVMLIDKNPASALLYLRTAQQEFPILDDYIRLWMGEAQLRQGEAKEAALAREFLAFVTGEKGRAILRKFGYGLP